MRTSLVIILFAAFMVACGDDPSSKIISQQELLVRITDNSSPLILDLRPKEKYTTGHIPGALHVDFESYKKSLDDLALKKSQEIVLYCEEGQRAKELESYLLGQGFFEVRLLEGQMKDWRHSQLPLTN